MLIALKEYGVEKLKPGDVLYFQWSNTRSLITMVTKGKTSPVIYIRPTHDETVKPYEWIQSDKKELSVGSTFVEVAE